MFELIICIAIGIVIGFSVFTVLTVSIMLNPKFMKWYSQQVTKYFEQLCNNEYDCFKSEIKES